MSTHTELPAYAPISYPPDLAAVAHEVLARLLQREHPLISLDPETTWLTFYELNTAGSMERQLLHSRPLRNSLFEHFLGQFSLPDDSHFALFSTAQSVAASEQISAITATQLRKLFGNFKDSLEQAYRQALSDYWNVVQSGGQSRRRLFINERKKALRLESRLGVERSLLTTTQHAMLDSVLKQGADASAPHKHGVYWLTLQEDQATPLTLSGAFVLTHTATTEAPSLKNLNLGEAVLYTANRGAEGFDSLAALGKSLKLRLGDALHKHILLRNIADEQREKLLARNARPHHWGLAAVSGNIMEAQFELQVQRQQADFSHLLRQARATAMPRAVFFASVPNVLRRYAQFDNAFVLDRNDRLLVNGITPEWWSASSHELQQDWVRAANNYGDAIVRMHLLSQSSDPTPDAVNERSRRWLSQARRLMTAQMQMGLARAPAEHLPAAAQAWIKAVIDSPEAGHRAKVEQQTIALEFLALDKQPLPDVFCIGPVPANPGQPLLVCTLNAHDNQIFRSFPDEQALREQLIDNPLFARYLLAQLPEDARPVAWRDVQYPLWLKHHHAPQAFSHLPQPAPLPAFSFGALTYVEQPRDFMQASHDLKLAILDAPRTGERASVGSSLATAALHIVPFFLPPPLLITLALGASLLKVWEGFRHVEEHDYKGAAHEFLRAVGYLSAAAVGSYLLTRAPFTALESVRSASPLIRLIGRDGEERIGYLLPHSSAPRLAEIDSVLHYDARIFRSIEVDGQAYFVKPFSNLFGHRQLYQQALGDPDLLISDGDYAVQGSSGMWRKTLYSGSRLVDSSYQAASRALAELTSNWPSTVEQVGSAETEAFHSDYLAMAQTSNTEQLPEVLDYCEAGSGPINTALRSGRQTAQTRLFLSQFYRLHEYRSMAFRATNVTLSGLQRLRNGVGLVFVDPGVQSASVSRWGAQQWSVERFVTQNASAGSRAVFLIFDTTIPKKNLFSSFLGDHVAVAPNMLMQLMAVREIDDKIYLYVSRATHIPQRLYELYSGVEERLL